MRIYIFFFKGTWITRVFFDEIEIQGSPFTFEVYDLSLTEIDGLTYVNLSSCPLNKKIDFKGIGFKNIHILYYFVEMTPHKFNELKFPAKI